MPEETMIDVLKEIRELLRKIEKRGRTETEIAENRKEAIRAYTDGSGETDVEI